MDDCIENHSERWARAYQLGMESLPYFQRIYNPHHPDLTVQLVRIAKLRLLISSDLDNEGLQLVHMARKHLNITHGCNHELHKVFQHALGS